MSTAEAPLAGRRAFRGLPAFVACQARVQYHEGIAILTSMLTPAVMLVFVAVLARPLFAVAFAGAIIFSAFNLGQRVLNEAAYIRIDHKLHQLFLASPLAPESYFLGIATGVLVVYLPPIVVFGVAADLLVRPSIVTGLVLIGATGLVWLFSASLGYVLSTFFRDQRAIWSYASLLYNLFAVLPPVFYPLGLFPAPLRPIALVLPPSAAAALVQDAMAPGLLSTSEIALSAGALATAALLTFLVALAWARSHVRED